MYKNILILPDGREISSGVGSVHAIRSLTLTEMVNSGTDLTIGSCCSDMLEATLFTPGGLDITAGTELTLLKEGPQGRVQMGLFTVETPTRPSPNTMKLTGFDRTARLDKDLTAWLESLTGWPYSIADFAALACAACGLDFLVETGFPNEDFQIRQWHKTGVTGRQILRWLGQIACRYVHADPQGNIRFGWYQDTGKELTPQGDSYYFAGALSYENYRVAPVDIVQLRLGSGESGGLWPQGSDGDNPYILTGNPILAAYVTEDLLPHLEAIRQALRDVIYTPCTVSALADPQVKAGSILHITDPNGNRLRAFVMEKTSTGKKDTYICTGGPRRDSTTAAYSKSQAEMQQQALDSLTQQALFDRLTDNGKVQGLYIRDGKWYINAEVAQILNLVAEVVSSRAGSSEMRINGAELLMRWAGKETAFLWNAISQEEGQETGAVPILYLSDYRQGQNTNNGELSATHLKLGGTSLMPGFYLSTTGGEPTLWLMGESKGKKLSWKKNSDGTFTLIGKE